MKMEDIKTGTGKMIGYISYDDYSGYAVALDGGNIGRWSGGHPGKPGSGYTYHHAKSGIFAEGQQLAALLYSHAAEKGIL